MFTRCANCDTWFRIGPEAVRAAHGQVRCGFCGEEFNALKTLCDNLPADAFERADSNGEPPAEAVAFEIMPEPENDISPESDRDQEPTADFPEAAEPEALEEIVPAEPPDTSTPEAWQAPPAEDSLSAAFGEPGNLSDEPGTAAEQTNPEREGVYPPARPVHRKRRRSPGLLVWIIGSVALLAAVLTQIVIYEREPLRDNPVTGPAIERLYAAFGHPLPPRRDLGALAISHAEVASVPGTGGALLVTATLTNHADFAQPYPKLRVSLTDRFGNPVRRGLFGAGDYLPHGTGTAGTLQAGEAQSVRLKIADPGTAAVGFVIVPCLETDAGPKCAGKSKR